MNKSNRTFTFNIYHNSRLGADKKASQLSDEDLDTILKLLQNEMTVREDARLKANELLRCADIGGWEDAIKSPHRDYQW